MKNLKENLFIFKVLFDEQQFDLKSNSNHLINRIEKRCNFLFETIEKSRTIYEAKITNYSEIYDTIRQEATTQLQTIDQHIQLCLKFVENIIVEKTCIYF